MLAHQLARLLSRHLGRRANDALRRDVSDGRRERTTFGNDTHDDVAIGHDGQHLAIFHDGHRTGIFCLHHLCGGLDRIVRRHCAGIWGHHVSNFHREFSSGIAIRKSTAGRRVQRKRTSYTRPASSSNLSAVGVLTEGDDEIVRADGSDRSSSRHPQCLHAAHRRLQRGLGQFPAGPDGIDSHTAPRAQAGELAVCPGAR